MGYDLYITRQQEWFEEDANLQISFAEWKAIVEAEPDMRMDSAAIAYTKDGEWISVQSEGLSVRTKYSKGGIDENKAWFGFENGNIDVKNPDEEIIGKMRQIAALLQAKIQGDDGEEY